MITVIKWLALYIIHNICILHSYAKKCGRKQQKGSGRENTTASQKDKKRMIQQPANKKGHIINILC